MSRHEQSLTEIRDKLVELDPMCAILVVGSVGRGVHRPDSDIDMIVVTAHVQAVAAALPWRLEHTHFGASSADQRLDT